MDDHAATVAAMAGGNGTLRSGQRAAPALFPGMRDISILLDNNRRWAAQRTEEDPGFFERLSLQQSPKFLWIGCSDSRVPANQITGLDPGEVFVHRNVGNVVYQTDLNCLSVLQFAIEVLKVEHVIVCGHYGCGAVNAAIDNCRHGMIDNWLRQIRQVAAGHQDELDGLAAPDRADRLCELNVLANARNVAQTTIVEDARERRQELQIHAWIYRLTNGRITPLQEPLAGPVC